MHGLMGRAVCTRRNDVRLWRVTRGVLVKIALSFSALGISVELDLAICEQARLTRDPRFDGRFFIGITSTGIYCRPICPSPHAKRTHVCFFPTAAAAAAAGFRPCLRCRPEVAPGTPAWRGTSDTVNHALRLISEGMLDDDDVDTLAMHVGVSARHLSRLFMQHLGTRPIAVAQTRRLHFAKQLITDTGLPMSQVALIAGFQSVRRFNDMIHQVYRRSPTELRRFTEADRAGSGAEEYRFELAYRPPYDWESLMAFLGARATPGVEAVRDGCYYRSIRLNSMSGTVEVGRIKGRHALYVRIRFPDPAQLLTIISRIRTMFDLTADPEMVSQHLSRDPLLAPLVRDHPGLRVPGAWDGFEMTVRAILGQQIRVETATRLAGRLTMAFGHPLGEMAAYGLTHSFPEPATLAQVEIAGLPGTRKHAIQSLARAVADGRIVFNAALTGGDLPQCFKSINGIGEWTIQYVAMRVLNDPNAFPAPDRVLRRVAGQDRLFTKGWLLRRAEPWKPWRAYAAMYLWRGSSS